jgi:diphosphomevalonate decarboxylase
LGRILDLDTDTISGLARSGSGSACRSIYGGFVHWAAGVESNGSDCVCHQLTPVDHWSNLRAIVVVVNSRVKRDSSTNGMQRSVETSQLYQRRLQLIPERIREVKESIAKKDFAGLADSVMRDSNQLHAICADTYPPMFYLTDASCHLIDLVHAYNEFHDNHANGGDINAGSPRPKVAYTFDAGPNCCLLMEEETVGEFLPYLCHYCPNSKEDKFIRGLTTPELHFVKRFAHGDRKISASSPSDRKNDRRWERLTPMPDSVEYVIVSKVGGAPHVIA